MGSALADAGRFILEDEVVHVALVSFRQGFLFHVTASFCSLNPLFYAKDRRMIPKKFLLWLAGNRNFFLTPGVTYGIIVRHYRKARAIHAGVAELVDARDLKSCVPKERAGSTPVSGTTTLLPQPYRGVEQLVARRAHNPEVAGSSPVPATRKTCYCEGNTSYFFISAPRVIQHRNVRVTVCFNLTNTR